MGWGEMRFFFLMALLILDIRPSAEFLSPKPGAASQITVILMLDNSGSMEKNDPNGLRFTGARLFLSLLDPGDTAGVIIFSTESISLTNSLVTIRSGEDKSTLVSQIHTQSPEGFTDVKAAFQTADRILNGFELDRRAVYIVFLTDGKPEIKSPYAGYEKETLEAAKRLHVPILAIALTPSAQTPFLDQLAIETGGQVIPADTALDLTDAYLNILGQIKDRTVLNATENDFSFFVDPGLAPYIDSVSFILARTGNDSVHLYSPFGEAIQRNSQNVRFYLENPGFVTIDIQSPSPGMWTFQTKMNGKFKTSAILHSRLRIEMDSPGNLHQQSKPMQITVRMTEELPDGKRVPILGDATFTAVITLPDGAQASLDLFYDDGTHGDALAGDGVFSRRYVNTHQAGTYAIQIRGHKANVPIEEIARVAVIPFPELIIQEPVGIQEFGGDALQLQVLLKDAGNYSLEGGTLVATIGPPSGIISEIGLMKNGETYSGSFVPKQEGIYQVQIRGKDAMYRGLPYEETVSSRFDVKFIRTLNIEADRWSANGCLDGRGYVPLHLHLFSPQPEIVQFKVFGVDGLQLNPPSIHSAVGSQEFLLQMSTPSGTFSPGKYQFHLDVESSSEFEQQPMPADFSFEVPNVFQRCGSAFRWGGLSGFVLLVAALFITWKIRADTAPALLSGTLRYWQESSGSIPSIQEQDLALFAKSNILVGSDASCDIQIVDCGLDEQHFALFTEKPLDGLQILLKPMGETHKGYSQIHGAVVLHHGDMFRIKDLFFQYLSDSGE